MKTVKPLPDPHYKATLEVALHGARLRFHVAQDLFSSAALDPGTLLLLRTLAGQRATRVLDVGCGYGPLGLFMKAWNPDAVVDLVDRDELAVRYSRANAALNGLEVGAAQSLGYDDVAGGGYDLIVSNIPAKAGPAVVESILLDAGAFLAPGGVVAVVAITRLAAEVHDHIGTPALEKTNRGYTCFHYSPPLRADYAPAFARGVYDRGRLRYRGTEITTVHGLPEFDTAGFATNLAVDLLPKARGHLVVLNPGQGLLPAAAGRAVSVDDRDLLAVRNTARNATVVDAKADTAVVLLRPREAVAVTLANLARHDVQRVLVAGTSTQVTRLLEVLPGDVVERRRAHGHSAALVSVRR